MLNVSNLHLFVILVERVSCMEQWWEDAESRKRKYSGQILSEGHVINYKSHTNFPNTETNLPNQKTTNKRLKYFVALDLQFLLHYTRNSISTSHKTVCLSLEYLSGNTDYGHNLYFLQENLAKHRPLNNTTRATLISVNI